MESFITARQNWLFKRGKVKTDFPRYVSARSVCLPLDHAVFILIMVFLFMVLTFRKERDAT